MSYDTKIIHKEFCATYLRTVNIIGWKFHLEARIVYVCARSDWFSRYICEDIIYCHNSDYIVLSPLGGILADRADRRNIMVALDGLTGMSVLCATLLLSESNALTVISVLLVILSVLGAFETPTVQACIPTMLQGDNIMKGNAVVNQVASLSYLVAPMLGSVLYAVFGLKPVMYASVVCFLLQLCLNVL